MSRTSPSWSTARHSTSARRRSTPPSRRDASDCSAADGTGVAVARSPVRNSAPKTDGLVRDVEPPFGEEFLDEALAIRGRTVALDTDLLDNVTDGTLRLLIGVISAGVLLLLLACGILPLASSHQTDIFASIAARSEAGAAQQRRRLIDHQGV